MTDSGSFVGRGPCQGTVTGLARFRKRRTYALLCLLVLMLLVAQFGCRRKSGCGYETSPASDVSPDLGSFAENGSEDPFEFSGESGAAGRKRVARLPGLPPDPGRRGKLSVEGVDDDSDGIRDDLQIFIATQYKNSPGTRVALRQVTSGMQELLTAPPSESDEARQASTRIVRGVECLYSVEQGKAKQVLARLSREVINTPDRAQAYFEAEGRLAGQIYPIASGAPFESSCDHSFKARRQSRREPGSRNDGR